MRPTIYPLFHLTEDGRYRLSFDDLQWIVEKRSSKQPQPGKDSGYRGLTYIATEKCFLMKALHRKGITPDPHGLKLLEALPDHFGKFKTEIDRLGVENYRAQLLAKAGLYEDDTGALKLASRAAAEEPAEETLTAGLATRFNFDLAA